MSLSTLIYSSYHSLAYSIIPYIAFENVEVQYIPNIFEPEVMLILCIYVTHNIHKLALHSKYHKLVFRQVFL